MIALLEGNSNNGLRQAVDQVPYYCKQSISFELHAKVAEEIDLQMCSYGQLSEVQMLRDLDLDLGSHQGHINIYSTCRTGSKPNHVTVASCTTKIWPFKFREISTFGEVWTLVIAFLEGNSKIGLWQAVGPILSPSTISFELHAKMAEEIDLEKCNFHNFGSSETLTLTLGWVRVTLVRISGWGLPTHRIRQKSENFLWTYGRMDVRTDGHTWVPIY